MDKALTILAWMISIPVATSSVMVWLGWRKGCVKEEWLKWEDDHLPELMELNRIDHVDMDGTIHYRREQK